MTITIKTKVLLKIGVSEMTCVELRTKVCTIKFCLTHVKLILTHTEHTLTMSPVNESQDYDY